MQVVSGGTISVISTARQVGQNVRRRRKEFGLTQRQLAEQSGVSERSIISLELGDATGMRLDKLLEVLSALGLAMSIEADGNAGVTDGPHRALFEKPQDAAHMTEPQAGGPVLAFLLQAQSVRPSARPSNREG